MSKNKKTKNKAAESADSSSIQAAAGPYLAILKTNYVRLITSGNREQYAKEPIVAIHPSGDFPKCYDVLLHMYLPDRCRDLRLDEDFNNTPHVETEAGNLIVRDIGITYDNPAHSPEIVAFSLWEMKFRYEILSPGTGVQAIRVRYTIGDPETTRGTVTTVEKT